MTTPIRVATAILSERIFAGRPTKDGRGFKEPRYDVTSDVLVAIRDKVGIGNEISVESNGVVEFRIAVLPPRDSDGSGEASETRSGLAEGDSAGRQASPETHAPKEGEDK
jgi:hypothetical protein